MSNLEVSSLEEWEVLDLLASLVDKSLVVYEEQPDGTGRYRLLESVRQYAVDRMGESGEAEVIQNAHLSWCVVLAEEAEPQLTGPEQGAWVSRMEAEHDNLRAGLSWGLSPKEHIQGERSNEGGLRLVVSVFVFWVSRGHLSEGRRWMGMAQARAGVSEEEALEGEALLVRANVLTRAGYLAQALGNLAEARALSEEGLALFQQVGDHKGCGWALLTLASLALDDLAEARALSEKGLTHFRQAGEQRGIAHTLRLLAEVAQRYGDFAKAHALREESMTLYRQAGNLGGIAETLGNLAGMAQTMGDFAKARALYAESLTLFQQVGEQLLALDALGELGVLAHQQDQMGRSVRLLGAAASLRESMDSVIFRVGPEEIDAMLASAAEALGEEAFAAAWDAGRAMTMEQAVEYALTAAPEDAK